VSVMVVTVVKQLPRLRLELCFLVLQACSGASPPATAPTQASPAESPQASHVPEAPAQASAATGVGATCKDGVRCPGEQPVCLIAPERVECVSESVGNEAPHDGRHLAFACSQASDCEGGLHCCTGGLGDRSRCAPSCDIANELELCAADAECASAGTQKVHCASLDPGELTLAMPPWVKVCQSADQP